MTEDVTACWRVWFWCKWDFCIKDKPTHPECADWLQKNNMTTTYFTFNVKQLKTMELFQPSFFMSLV